MNTKLLLKTVFLLAMLGILVLIGKNNTSTVSFSLPPVLKSVKAPSSMMYYTFFAVGVITGTILTSGKGGKAGGGGGSSKPARKDK